MVLQGGNFPHEIGLLKKLMRKCLPPDVQGRYAEKESNPAGESTSSHCLRQKSWRRGRSRRWKVLAPGPTA
jgi:hypothetical protein